MEQLKKDLQAQAMAAAGEVVKAAAELTTANPQHGDNCRNCGFADQPASPTKRLQKALTLFNTLVNAIQQVP